MNSLFSIGDRLSVAMVQCESIDAVTSDDVDRNAQALCNWVEWCARAYEGIDLVVFPECSLQGSHPEMPSSLYVSIPDEVTGRLIDSCKANGVWAVFNVLERSEKAEGGAYNVSFLVNSQGQVVLKQHKVNPFVPTENSVPGAAFQVCDGPKDSTIGIMTCYDGDFPEVARELAFRGANVLLRPSSYMEPYSEPWTFVNRARAYENLAYVIAVNRTGITYQYNWFGKSMAVGFDGQVLSQGPSSVPWVSKVDIRPADATKMRETAKVHNHPYNLKHRGYVGEPPNGDERNPYSVYRDWK